MKDKGKGVPIEGVAELSEREIVVSEPTIDPETSILDPCLISSVFGEFDDDEDNEEDDNLIDDADEVYSVHDDDDDQAMSGIKVTEASNEENGNAEDVDHVIRLILHLEHGVKEGEIRHTYTLAEIIKMTHVDENEFNFDFEEELNNQANVDELRRKVAESVKNKSFQEMSKDEQHEERKKWFRKDTERKFKRPLQYYRRDRDVSLGDIISWGFLPQYIQDIMSLPWWDVEELPKVRTLSYPVREHDMPTWGLMKFEAFRDFKHSKPHYPKKVKRIDPVTSIEETILQIKKPRVLKNIPLPKMEQNFREGFIYWVYKCITTEEIIEFRVGNEIRNILVYNPMWLLNCSAKDIECLFVNKIGYRAENM
ncbi:hypothetical protein Hanom_Chr00s000007g01615151 [Helianthus anomalus]